MAGKQRSVSIIIEAKNRADQALKSVGLSLNGLAIAGAAAAAAIAGVGAVLKKAVDAASEQQEADVRLAASLRAIGQNTRETREDLAQFIDSLQFASRFTDEAIASVVTALNPLRRFGVNVKEATQALVDFAAKTGEDVTAATNGLINVVVKGTGRIQGINTRFEEGATAGEKYASVIRQMKAISEGTAEAMTKTFAGALDQINKHIESQLEKLGDVIIKNKAVQDALAQTAVSIDQAGAAVNSGNKEFAGLVTITGKLWENALKAGPALGKVGLGVASALPGVGSLVSGLRGLWQMLGLVHTETVDIPEALGPAGKGISDLGDDATKSASALQLLFDKAGAGVPGFEELEKRAEDIRKALDELQKQGAANPLIPPEFIDAARKALAQAAIELQKFGVFVPGLIAGADGAKESLERLGIEIPNIAQSSRDVGIAWQAIQDLAAGGLGAEAVQGLNEQLLAAIEQLRQMGVAVQSPFTIMQELAIELTAIMEDELTNAALAVGDAFVDAAFGAKVSWADTIRQILAGIAKAIIRALILKAIQLGLSFAGGPAGAAAGAAVTTVVAQHGGEVRGGTFGLDSIAALLTPGEIVLPRSRAEDFDAIAGLAREVRAGGRSGGGAGERPALLGAFQILPRRDERDISEIIEGITRLVERRGYRLVASEVLA